MTWLTFFVRIPALAVATPVAIVAAILIAAIYGYRLEIDAIGLRFDKNPGQVSMDPARK
jgi:hypothetical protein